ncbi:MAG TPA: HAD family phosphatase [Acidobacteriaceae bacterium]|jgi:putative hydrolase of the HAD superfamily|nr:HAD family phosphatase [Acidobacteriaceae bacterium]
MNGISTMLWDVGGVLLTNAWDHQQRDAVVARFGLDRADFELRHAELAEPWERDEVGIEEYLRRTVFFQPRAFSQSEFLDAIRAQSTVLSDGALGIVRQLAASEEYVLATVNNESRAMNEFRLKKFGLSQVFSAFFTSCYLSVRKPDLRLYRIALDVLQCDPEDVVFIDDRPENVAAAASLGIHGIRYEGSAQLADELMRLGISLERDGADLLRA